MYTDDPYRRFPTLEQWKKDSSVTMASRSSDRILSRIDTLVEVNERLTDQAAKDYTRTELYFCLDKWVQIAQRGGDGTMKKRLKAVLRLYQYVVESLTLIYDVDVNILPRELEDMFGREMGDHGSMLDKEWDCAKYLTRAQAGQYALRFKKGKAYQLSWWSSGSKSKLMLAESSRAHVDGMFRESDSGKYGGFAMSMSSTIYMAKHHCGPGLGTMSNHYHSSYLGGEAVMCSGSLLIRRGKVLRIRTDSGHYQPTSGHMLNVINALKMWGADLTELHCVEHDLSASVRASDFVGTYGNWQKLLERKQANLQHRQRREQEKGEAVWLLGVWDYYQDQAQCIAYIRSYFPAWSNQKAWEKLVAAHNRLRRTPMKIKQDRAKKT